MEWAGFESRALSTKEEFVPTRIVALRSALAAVLLLAFSIHSRAESFSAVFVFGDSLSDNGNLYSAVGYPPPPYYNGRFSNGPVAVEQLAGRLNAPLFDFAWGGATTGLGNQIDGGSQTSPGLFHLPGMVTELTNAPIPAVLVPSSLFVVWGGANDFEDMGSATTAVSNIDAIVASLQGVGAQHILVPGLPDLGLTPEFYGDPTATLFSQQFNAGLQSSLPAGATYSDVYGLLNTIVADPGAYGFSNVTTPCFTGFSVCSDPSSYLFWDNIHPTTAADALLGAQFATAVTPTPEPSSLVLLGSGVAAAAGVLRRRRAA